MHEPTKKFWGHFIFALTILAGSFFIFRTFDIVALIDGMPTHKTLLALFPIATFAGVSVFTAGSFYVAITEIAQSSIPLWQLILVAGVGLTVGDIIFYVFGRGLETMAHDNLDSHTSKIILWLEKKPRWVRLFAVYIYSGWLPLPGDILMLALSFLRIPPRDFFIPILLGNITFIANLAFFGITVLG